METSYAHTDLSRDQVSQWRGAAIVEFGTDWCGHCQAAQSPLTEVLTRAGDIRHVKVEDGPGRALGRSFGVKLWPTFVFLKDGDEVARVVRPRSATELEAALRQITE